MGKDDFDVEGNVFDSAPSVSLRDPIHASGSAGS